MTESFDRYTSEIKKLLSGYGQDLAMQGAGNWDQRFGTPDIALAIVPIVGWFIKTVLETIIDYQVKKKLERDSLEQRIAALEAKLKAVEILVEGSIRREIPMEEAPRGLCLYYSDVLVEYQTLGKPDDQPAINPEELIRLLQDLGLTRRKAIKLSSQIIAVSEDALSGR